MAAKMRKNLLLYKAVLSDGSAIFATEMVKATNDKGNEVRLMPYAELMQWKVNGDQVQGTLHGWQQVGAEAVVYQELGKRITTCFTG